MLAVRFYMTTLIDIAPEFTAQQTEFPLAVAVCAWCKPKSGTSALAVLSHGICPRHLRNMQSKVKHKSKPGR